MNKSYTSIRAYLWGGWIMLNPGVPRVEPARSSKEGPRRSMTITLYSPSTPYQCTAGICTSANSVEPGDDSECWTTKPPRKFRWPSPSHAIGDQFVQFRLEDEPRMAPSAILKSTDDPIMMDHDGNPTQELNYIYNIYIYINVCVYLLLYWSTWCMYFYD